MDLVYYLQSLSSLFCISFWDLYRMTSTVSRDRIHSAQQSYTGRPSDIVVTHLLQLLAVEH